MAQFRNHVKISDMYIRDNGTTVFFAMDEEAGILHVGAELC